RTGGAAEEELHQLVHRDRHRGPEQVGCVEPVVDRRRRTSSGVVRLRFPAGTSTHPTRGSRMSAWLVRQEGSPAAVSVPSAAEVLAGLRDGNWLPSDEVKGPADAEWQPIQAHPAFAEAAAEVDPPKPEPKD